MDQPVARGPRAGARTAPHPRSGRALDAALVVTVLGAIALALGGVVKDPDQHPAGAVAVVNGHPIMRSEFDAVLGRLAAQLDHQPGAAERAEVLARLIDEELLVQRGLALDLPRGDVRLRGQLVQEVMSQALSGVSGQPVEEAELVAFHAANQGFFGAPARLRARRYDFTDAGAARAFLAELAGGDPAVVLARHADARNPLLPDALLPEGKLRDFVGADTTTGLAALAPGTGVVQELPGGGASALVLLAVQPGGASSFAEVRAQVETEFRRRRDEQAIAGYLRRLREDARIVAGGGG